MPGDHTRLRRAWEHAAALTAAWRQLHSTAPTIESLGPRPAGQAQREAYDALATDLADIAAQVRTRPTRTRPTHTRPAVAPRELRYIAAAHLAAARAVHAGRTRPAGPQHTFNLPTAPQVPDPDPAAAWAAPATLDLAQAVLAAVTDGQSPPEEWMAYLPAPDAGDAEQEHLFTDLVAAIAAWRATQLIAGEDPLGEEPDDEDAAEQWQYLTQALQAYQASRVRDRLAQIRARRAEDSARLEAVTRQENARTARPRRPGTGRRGPRRKGNSGPGNRRSTP